MNTDEISDLKFQVARLSETADRLSKAFETLAGKYSVASPVRAVCRRLGTALRDFHGQAAGAW